MTQPTDSRQHGVEFGSLLEDLDEDAFPMECAKMVDRHGGKSIEYAGGGATLEDLLASFDVTFYNVSEIRELILTAVGMDAVGRSRYTDRGGAATGEYSNWHGDTL